MDTFEVGLKRAQFDCAKVRDEFLAQFKFHASPIHYDRHYYHYYSERAPLRMTTTTDLVTGMHASAGMPSYPERSFDASDPQHKPYTHYMSLAGTYEQIAEATEWIERHRMGDEMHGPVWGRNEFIDVPPHLQP